jgi:hypothetical protein
MRIGTKSATIAVGAVSALLASGGAPALGTPHATHVRAVAIATPTLELTMGNGATKNDPPTFEVSGPRTFSAGRLNLVLHAKKGDQDFAVLRLHSGYTLAKLAKDFGTVFSSEDPTPASIKAINRIARRTTFVGGIESGTGHKTVKGSVVLAKPGTYYVIDLDPAAPKPVKLHVTAKAGTRTAPTASAHVTAVNAHRFRGSTNLPASGTIEFTNKATNSPHFLNLLHVKDGTTRKDVLKAFQCGGPDCAPPPFLRDSVGTDVLHPGKSQMLTYTLPAGDYAELCFFPDLKTGMPHAFMGMVRIVHLS